MDIFIKKRVQPAFTRTELIVVISVTAILVALLIPAMGKQKARPSSIRCSNNLKQIVLSAFMFAEDNNGCFPFTATNSPAYQETNAAWRHFLSMSNELGSTKILACPEDLYRKTNSAVIFGDAKDPQLPSLSDKQNSAISYFIALRPRRNQSSSNEGIFFGDRNILIQSRQPKESLINLAPGEELRWDTSIHKNLGNVAHTDGSVSRLIATEKQAEPKSITLLLPTTR
jgi:type II secretory pathway pseudopilin PulG